MALPSELVAASDLCSNTVAKLVAERNVRTCDVVLWSSAKQAPSPVQDLLAARISMPPTSERAGARATEHDGHCRRQRAGDRHDPPPEENTVAFVSLVLSLGPARWKTRRARTGSHRSDSQTEIRRFHTLTVVVSTGRAALSAGSKFSATPWYTPSGAWLCRRSGERFALGKRGARSWSLKQPAACADGVACWRRSHGRSTPLESGASAPSPGRRRRWRLPARR